MQTYNAHNQYFEQLCNKTKIFSHGRIDTNTGDVRKTFFRMNQVEEALNGQVSGMHFPALIHNEFAVTPVDRSGDDRLLVVNNFWVLVKPADAGADAIEAAYTLAETALQKLISRMLQEYEKTESCGPFKRIELSMFSWEATGAELDGLHGFHLTIRDEQRATEITTYNTDDYYE